jgi:general secretion pathway protein L
MLMIYLKSSVGIEIRQGDLLISSLQSNFSTGVFTKFQRIAGYCTRDRQEVRKEIDAFFKSQRLAKDNVVLGLPRNEIVLRHLDLPVEVAENLKQVVLYQVQSFEPTEEEKFYFDYFQLKNSPDSKRILVLLVMIKKSVLDNHLKILGELGIKPAVVIGSSIALTNLFFQNGASQEKKTFVLADLASAELEVIALRGGSLLYSHQARRAPEASWKDALLPELETAASKIRLGPEDDIERLVLSGESAAEARLEVNDALKECELMSSFIRFEIPVQNRANLQEAAIPLGLAYTGLVRRPAMRMNLLPAALRIHQTHWAFAPTILLGLAILMLLGGIVFRQSVQERILIRRLDAESLKLKARVSSVQTLINEADAQEKKIKYLEDLLRQRDKNLEVLRELTLILPADTFLNVYTNNEGTIALSGSSASAPDLIPKLEKSPVLMNVVQRGTIFKDAQTGKDRFNFEARLEK